jgi:tRNA-specific 2-thiouridylase
MPERILCAMSGGVDSSTAAALCVEAGHEVVGVTLHLSDAPPGKRRGRCCASEDIEDARRVARHLKIPHYTLDRRELFRTRVMDRFVSEYVAGRTPTPCTDCNDSVKIAPLLALARRLGMDALATGHYARVGARDGRASLLRAADPDKDQSYFLFPATPDVLSGLRFPLGDLTKKEVRAAARRMGLPVADKPESMEVCFAADGAAAFVERERPDLPRGEVVTPLGETIGRHAGVHRFTVGQRRGLPATSGRRLYVLSIDAATARVVAGPESALLQGTVALEDVRWHETPSDTLFADVQIRHRALATPAVVRPTDGGATVAFHEPQRAVAPGQAAVLYRGDRVIGGGWISAALAGLALAVLPACEVGNGEGEAKGTVHIPKCDLDGDFDLDPDYFAADAFEESLIIRVQHGGDFVQFADGLVFGVSDRHVVADSLGTPIEVVAPDPDDNDAIPPLVRASFFLAKSCEETPGLTGTSGTVTFSSIYSSETDRIAATFDVHFDDVVGGAATADLAGSFDFDYERGRPAQRYP